MCGLFTRTCAEHVRTRVEHQRGGTCTPGSYIFSHKLVIYPRTRNWADLVTRCTPTKWYSLEQLHPRPPNLPSSSCLIYSCCLYIRKLFFIHLPRRYDKIYFSPYWILLYTVGYNICKKWINSCIALRIRIARLLFFIFLPFPFFFSFPLLSFSTPHETIRHLHALETRSVHACIHARGKNNRRIEEIKGNRKWWVIFRRARAKSGTL